MVGHSICGQWLEVDLGANFWIKGLRVQGKEQCYVKTMGLTLSARYQEEHSRSFDLKDEVAEDADVQMHRFMTMEDNDGDGYDDGYDDNDDLNLHDACFILPEPIFARFVCVKPYEQGGRKDCPTLPDCIPGVPMA